MYTQVIANMITVLRIRNIQSDFSMKNLLNFANPLFGYIAQQCKKCQIKWLPKKKKHFN